MNSPKMISDSIRKGRQILYYAIFWTILAFGIGLIFNQILNQRHRNDQAIAITNKLGTMRARLEERINTNLFVVYGMAANLSVRSEMDQKSFDNLASVLLSQSESLKNIAIAPDFIIRYVYPLKGNEAILGLDYRSVPGQWERAKAARDSGRMAVAGPLNLVQGGRGLVARVPVFTSPEHTFWGLVSSVIDFDNLLKQSGFVENETDLNMALRGSEGKGEAGDIFWGDPKLFDKDTGAVTMSVSLPSGSWQLAAVPNGGWRSGSPYGFLVYMVTSLAALIGFGGNVYRLRSKLALIESENRFKAMSIASIDPLIMINDQDDIIFWNPAAEVMFGFKAEEVIGRKFHDLVVRPKERDMAIAGLEEFRKTGKGPVMDRVLEMEAVRRSGEVFPVERSVAAFFLKGKWYAVGSLRDITARKEAERKLTELATLDALTGLYNRRYFLEQTELQMRQAIRYQKDISFIMFDLDHFKAINDTYGHDTGDRVLQAVGRTVKQILREVDIIGRIGGEEFAVAMPETNIEAGRQVAERIRSTLMDTRVETPNGTVRFTVSIGLTRLGSAGVKITELMKQADQALYQAKGNGRNQVAVFSSDLS